MIAGSGAFLAYVGNLVAQHAKVYGILIEAVDEAEHLLAQYLIPSVLCGAHQRECRVFIVACYGV